MKFSILLSLVFIVINSTFFFSSAENAGENPHNAIKQSTIVNVKKPFKSRVEINYKPDGTNQIIINLQGSENEVYE